MLTTAAPTSIALIAALAAGLWGLFWIPLRMLTEAGVSPAWAAAGFFLAPTIALLPIAIVRRQQLRNGGFGLLTTGILLGSSLALYTDALLLTEVVRALLLFYLTPIWSTLLERVLLQVPIRGIRLVSIAIGIVGLLTILGADHSIPLPRNSGDWMGLLSGMLWALATVRLRTNHGHHATEHTCLFFGFGSLIAIGFAVSGLSPGSLPASMPGFIETAPWLLGFTLLVVLPSSWVAVWTAKHISPGLLGMLFMTELSVGTITAAIWANEPFGIREVLGVVLVSLAGMLEVLVGAYAANRRKQAMRSPPHQ